MSKSTDFSNMTLEELTPIVSMRPGKEYSREELRAARAAFMAALENTDSAACEPAEVSVSPVPPEETELSAVAEVAAEPEMPYVAEDVASALPDENPLPPTPVLQKENPEELPPLPPLDPQSTARFPSVQKHAEDVFSPSDVTEHLVKKPENAVPYSAFPGVPIISVPEADPPSAPGETAKTDWPVSEDEEEEFILKTDSRLARFLYILYAYLLLPLLAVEALVFLLAGVAAAVTVPEIPYLIVQILCTAVYTMTVTVAWHQLLHRTHFGLLLNRALIVVCILRGVSMLLSQESILTGIILLALSALFLVFFIAYDSTFTVKSPGKQRAQ